MNEDSKVVIVSGGSRGLGQAAVEGFLKDGHRVATFSRAASAFIQTNLDRDPAGSVFHWTQLDATEFQHLRALRKACFGDGAELMPLSTMPAQVSTGF